MQTDHKVQTLTRVGVQEAGRDMPEHDTTGGESFVPAIIHKDMHSRNSFLLIFAGKRNALAQIDPVTPWQHWFEIRCLRCRIGKLVVEWTCPQTTAESGPSSWRRLHARVSPWPCTAGHSSLPSSLSSHLKLRDQRQLMPTKAQVTKKKE